MIILKILLKIIIAMVQIPLTLLYFVLNLIGGAFSCIGWIAGIVVFIITGICWLFGQFDAWYQPLFGVAIAGVLAFGPMFVTDVGGSAVLKIKGLLHMIA